MTASDWIWYNRYDIVNQYNTGPNNRNVASKERKKFWFFFSSGWGQFVLTCRVVWQQIVQAGRFAQHTASGEPHSQLSTPWLKRVQSSEDHCHHIIVIRECYSHRSPLYGLISSAKTTFQQPSTCPSSFSKSSNFHIHTAQEAQLPQRDSASATHVILARSLIVHFTEHSICCTTIIDIVVSTISPYKPSPYTWPMKLSNIIYFQGYLSCITRKPLTAFVIMHITYYKRPHTSRYVRDDAV